MALTEMNVAQPAKDADAIAVYAQDGWHAVVAVIPRAHLQTHLARADLTSSQAALVVRSNIDTIGRVMQDKYSRGAFTTNNTTMRAAPRVIYFNLEDIERAGPSLNDQVLNLPSGWVSPDGRW